MLDIQSGDLLTNVILKEQFVKSDYSTVFDLTHKCKVFYKVNIIKLNIAPGSQMTTSTCV